MLFVQLMIDGLAIGVVFVILAAGMVIITSVNKLLFIAYGIFYTIGAYATWYGVHTLNCPYFLSLVIGAIAPAILGMLTYILIFRRILNNGGGFLGTLLGSLGLYLFLGQGCIVVFGTVSRRLQPVFAGSFNHFGLTITDTKILIIGLSVAVGLFLFWLYEKTKLGRSMRSIAFHSEAASLQGVNTSRVYILSLALGTGLAGIAGGILAPNYGINPDMGTNIIWTVMLMIMFGGMDSLLGAVVGGVVIGEILSFGQYYIGSADQIVAFVIIGILLYFRPNGLLGRGIDIGI